MMKSLLCNTVEAKTKLNELLNYIAKGQEVIIKRYGKIVAKIIPATEQSFDHSHQTKNFIGNLKQFHKKIIKNHGQKSDTVALLRGLRQESS